MIKLKRMLLLYKRLWRKIASDSVMPTWWHKNAGQTVLFRQKYFQQNREIIKIEKYFHMGIYTFL